jgi:hypothetical protein
MRKVIELLDDEEHAALREILEQPYSPRLLLC